ncbi:MAG: Hsp20/alpha crystallin family protein [Candidatus Kariarchaeaceae archaeon]|jgi:HSP20 family molecular chaperone IbpA
MFGKKMKKMGFGPHFDNFYNKEAYQTRSNGDLVVTILLPGIVNDSLSIRAKSSKMILKAERKSEIKDITGQDDVELVIDLEDTVMPNSAKAKYTDGVLTVSFPLENPGYEVEDINYE